MIFIPKPKNDSVIGAMTLIPSAFLFDTIPVYCLENQPYETKSDLALAMSRVDSLFDEAYRQIIRNQIDVIYVSSSTTYAEKTPRIPGEPSIVHGAMHIESEQKNMIMIVISTLYGIASCIRESFSEEIFEDKEILSEFQSKKERGDYNNERDYFLIGFAKYHIGDLTAKIGDEMPMLVKKLDHLDDLIHQRMTQMVEYSEVLDDEV